MPATDRLEINLPGVQFKRHIVSSQFSADDSNLFVAHQSMENVGPFVHPVPVTRVADKLTVSVWRHVADAQHNVVCQQLVLNKKFKSID